VAESALVFAPALVALRIEEPPLGLVEASARIAGHSSGRLEADLARFRAAHRVLVQRRQLALVRRGAVTTVWTAGGDRAVLIEQRRAIRAWVVLLRQADWYRRTRRRATRDLHHPARLVLAAAGHGATRIAARTRRATRVRVQFEAIRTIELAVDFRASQGRVTARHDPFEDPSARRLLAFLVYAPAHAIVALHRLERTVGVASGYVGPSRGLARFSGGMLSDRASVLAGRGHDRRHALRAAAGRATFVTGRTLLIVTALQFTAG